MKTMTIRNVPEDVSAILKTMATSEHSSLNSTVIKVLAAGTLPQKPKRTRRNLSRFCGGWSQKDIKDFERAVADCEQVDPENWK